MKDILNIINQLQNTSGRNDKESILKQNVDNKLFKSVLYFVFNPYIITGISSKKIKKKLPVSSNMCYDLNDIEDIMEYIKDNNTGKDNNIAKIQAFLKYRVAEDEIKTLYEQIITKSLKLGIEAKTINKIYGKDFIPQFNVMLAEKYFECEDKVNGEFIVTQKLDGIRCVIIKEYDSIKIFSRQGQPIDDLVEILEEAKLLPDNMVYDGELILVNLKNLASKDLYRETVKVARKDGVKKNLIFNCFDMLPIDGFKVGISKLECWRRKALLHNTLKDMDLNFIVEVPILYQGTDKEMIVKLLDEAIAKDQEGVMVNIANAPYECKRTKNILKVKKFNDADVKVVGVLEGTGKNIGKLGAITIQFTHENKIYECNCGSGFSDTERELYWSTPDLLLNKIVTIGYFEISQNQNGGVGLRFPTWKSIIRDDKTQISMY